MFTLADRRWSPSITALCGLPAEVLPPVVDPGTVVGEVSAAAAEATGLRAGTTVVAGGADTPPGPPGAGAERDENTVGGGTFWPKTGRLGAPLIDPEARLRTLGDVSPGAGAWGRWCAPAAGPRDGCGGRSGPRCWVCRCTPRS